MMRPAPLHHPRKTPLSQAGGEKEELAARVERLSRELTRAKQVMMPLPVHRTSSATLKHP